MAFNFNIYQTKQVIFFVRILSFKVFKKMPSLGGKSFENGKIACRKVAFR